MERVGRIIFAVVLGGVIGCFLFIYLRGMPLSHYRDLEEDFVSALCALAGFMLGGVAGFLIVYRLPVRSEDGWGDLRGVAYLLL